MAQKLIYRIASQANMNKHINTKYLYKLPWTESDNPNGWIEPTTFCNIVCPGCYRGIDQHNHQSKHLSLEEVKQQVDWFVTNRNVHTISIAGGEPLMYPHLKELVAYAASRKVRVMLYTNGLLLTQSLAEELTELGLTQLLVHVSSDQNRPEFKQHSCNELRIKFVEMLKDIPGLRFGFIQPLVKNDEAEIADLMRFLQENINLVNLMVFTLYRDICTTDKQPVQSAYLNLDEAVQIINKYGEFKPTAYLSSEKNPENISWLFGQRMGVNHKIFGSVSSSFYSFAHRVYRKRKSKHLFISRSNRVSLTTLLKFLFRPSVLKITANYIFNGLSGKGWNKGSIHFQTILIIRAPEQNAGKWDLCEGCPDRMIYDGRLVPSCILENLKNGATENFKAVNLEN